jgi:hypothetical protein
VLDYSLVVLAYNVNSKFLGGEVSKRSKSNEMECTMALSDFSSYDSLPTLLGPLVRRCRSSF